MDLIAFIAGAFLGWWLGSKFTDFLHRNVMTELLKELNVTEAQLRKVAEKNGIKLPEPRVDSDEDELEEIHIKLEQHQGQIYAFRIDNDGFLGQGSDRESLFAALRSRMDNVRLIVDEGSDLIKKPSDA